MYEHKTRYLYMPDRCLQGHLEQRQWVSISIGPQSSRHVFTAYDSYTHQKPIIDPMLYLLSSFTSMVFIYEFINSLKIIFNYPIICKKQKKKNTETTILCRESFSYQYISFFIPFVFLLHVNSVLITGLLLAILIKCYFSTIYQML